MNACSRSVATYIHLCVTSFLHFTFSLYHKPPGPMDLGTTTVSLPNLEPPLGKSGYGSGLP